MKKLCIFVPVIRKKHNYIFCSNSPDELAPQKEKEEQNLTSIGVYA